MFEAYSPGHKDAGAGKRRAKMNVRSAFPVGTAKTEIAVSLRGALVQSALPGEADNLSADDFDHVVTFVLNTAWRRTPGEPVIDILSSGEMANGHRRMRLVTINDDMPFLVDSVAQAVAAHGLEINQLLHPVVSVRRNEEGSLTNLLAAGSNGDRRESIIYMEIERADARVRRTLEQDIRAALAQVRAAV